MKMLKKSCFLLAFIGAATLFLCGCMSVDCVMTETFEPTEEVKIYDKAADVPYSYKVIGVCQTEGNYTEFSYDDMMERMTKEAKANGADGIVVLGIRVVPDGRVVQTSPLRSSLDGTSSASGNPWEEISRDFGGGYGSIRSKSFGASQTYDRIIRARFIRYKRDAQGEFIPRGADDKDALEAVIPLKKIKDIKKEKKNAAAN